VKSCIYCGTENVDEKAVCTVCKNSLTREAVGEDEFFPACESVDICSIDLNCFYENGFPYPDWRKIFQQIKSTFQEGDWRDVWQEISKRWLLELKESLGGDYRCFESHDFLFLGNEGSAVSRTLLSYAESSLETIESNLGQLVNRKSYGKHVIIAFSEPDDYYGYVSYFHTDGEHSLSAGIFLSRGYMHIAFPFKFVYSSKHVITHELVHNCIAHLHVPTWIHEGMAQRLEGFVIGRGFLLDREMAARHYEYWDAERIQKFWSGASFYGPDEGNELSYHLSQVLIEILAKNWNDFLSFVQAADIGDAGQDAALKILGRSLGQTLEDFLGPGEWRPQRRAIAAHFEKMKKPKITEPKEIATDISKEY
jgi:hypothetical protein